MPDSVEYDPYPDEPEAGQTHQWHGPPPERFGGPITLRGDAKVRPVLTHNELQALAILIEMFPEIRQGVRRAFSGYEDPVAFFPTVRGIDDKRLHQLRYARSPAEAREVMQGGPIE